MTGEVNTAAALAELETPPAPETVDKAMVGTTGKVIDPNGVQVAAHYNNHPSGVEAIEVCRCLNFNVGNAFKYVFRRDEKPEPGLTLRDSTLKNLDKALWYLKDELSNLGETASGRSCGILGRIAEAELNAHAKEFYLAVQLLSGVPCDRDLLNRSIVAVLELKASLA